MTSAGDPHKVDPATVRDLIATMERYDRVIPVAEFDRLIDDFGWRTTPDAAGKEPYYGKASVQIHASWDFGGYEVMSLFRQSEIYRTDIRLTSLIYPPTSESTLFMQDAFAEYAAIAQKLLGPPTRCETGESQEMHWRGTISTITLVATGSRVSVELALNSYYDDQDIAIEMDT